MELDRLLVRIEADVRPLQTALRRVSEQTATAGQVLTRDVARATQGFSALTEQVAQAGALAGRSGAALDGMLDDNTRRVLTLADTIQGVLGRALRGSIDSWSALRQVALSALDDILRALVKTIDGAGSGGGSGGGIFGGLGDLFGGLGGIGGLGGLGGSGGGGLFDISPVLRSAGGPVEPGRLYEVGEAGRELFVPSQPGRIMSRLASDSLLGRAGGGLQVHNSYNIDARGAQHGVGAEIVAALDARSERIKDEAVQQVFALMDRGGRFAKTAGRRRG